MNKSKGKDTETINRIGPKFSSTQLDGMEWNWNLFPFSFSFPNYGMITYADRVRHFWDSFADTLLHVIKINGIINALLWESYIY